MKNRNDRCYDHEFMIATPIAYDHGYILIGQRELMAKYVCVYIYIYMYTLFTSMT